MLGVDLNLPLAAILAPEDEEREDPVRLRGSLVATRWAFGEEASAMREFVRKVIRRAEDNLLIGPGHTYACVERALQFDRRFELSMEDLECAFAAGGARAVYEVWTGESGAWVGVDRYAMVRGGHKYTITFDKATEPAKHVFGDMRDAFAFAARIGLLPNSMLR